MLAEVELTLGGYGVVSVIRVAEGDKPGKAERVVDVAGGKVLANISFKGIADVNVLEK